MRLVALALLGLATACGARTSLESGDVAGTSTGAGMGASSSSASNTWGALCAWQTGVVASCDAGDAGDVQRCQPDEECALHDLPNPGFGESPVYECCTGSSQLTCAGRQFETGYICQ